MTTLAAARTALLSAVGASDDYVDPPGCMVFSEGADLSQIWGDGSLIWRWRVTCYVGYKSDSAASDVELSAYVAAKALVLLSDPVWGVVSASPATIRTIAGGDHLAADIAVFTRVTLA
jgi:hypothetical protein